jgi:hypothetical protein
VSAGNCIGACGGGSGLLLEEYVVTVTAADNGKPRVKVTTVTLYIAHATVLVRVGKVCACYYRSISE